MNTRRCTRCGVEHWQDRRLCCDCTEDELRPTTQVIIDENAWYEDRIQAVREFGLKAMRKDQVHTPTPGARLRYGPVRKRDQ